MIVYIHDNEQVGPGYIRVSRVPQKGELMTIRTTYSVKYRVVEVETFANNHAEHSDIMLYLERV